MREKSTTRTTPGKRIVIEHTICRMKKYRIMGDIFRNRLRDYDRIRYSIRAGKLQNTSIIFLDGHHQSLPC